MVPIATGAVSQKTLAASSPRPRPAVSRFSSREISRGNTNHEHGDAAGKDVEGEGI
jgi:hypothetical protein